MDADLDRPLQQRASGKFSGRRRWLAYELERQKLVNSNWKNPVKPDSWRQWTTGGPRRRPGGGVCGTLRRGTDKGVSTVAVIAIVIAVVVVLALVLLATRRFVETRRRERERQRERIRGEVAGHRQEAEAHAVTATEKRDEAEHERERAAEHAAIADEHAKAAEERERRAAEAEERAKREGRAAGLHDERAAERERELD